MKKYRLEMALVPKEKNEDGASGDAFGTGTSCRRIKKHISERKRRARISQALDQIKVLLLETLKQEGTKCSFYSKLEKADILEMTVEHLRKLQQAADKKDQMFRMMPLLSRERYVLGFTECAAATANFLDSDDTAGHTLKTNVQRHLENCLTTMTSLGSSHVTTIPTRKPYESDDALETSPKQTEIDDDALALLPKKPDVSVTSSNRDKTTSLLLPAGNTESDLASSRTATARKSMAMHSTSSKTENSEALVDSQLASSSKVSGPVCDFPRLPCGAPWRPW